MGLFQQITPILLKGPQVCTNFYSRQRPNPRPVIMMFRSSISTSEWEPRQPVIEHEIKMGRTIPSRPELNFHGFCTQGSDQSYPPPAENCLGSGTKQWPRPTAIPWQVKVANAVHLMGTIKAPVEIIHMNQGKIRAATVLVKKSPSPFNCLWCCYTFGCLELANFITVGVLLWSCGSWFEEIAIMEIGIIVMYFGARYSVGVPCCCLGYFGARRIRLIFEDDLAETAACYLKLGDLVYVSGQLDADSQCSTNEMKQSVAQVLVNNLNFIKRDFPANSYEKGDVLLNKTDRECSPSPGFNRGPK